MDNPKTSKQLLNELLDRHYEDAFNAKAEGKLVAWATSISPQELLTTAGIYTVYPENHAAAIGARKCSQDFINYSEGKGYSVDICSCACQFSIYGNFEKRCGKHAETGPDFLLQQYLQYGIKWYENIAKQLNIPMVLIDIPFNHEYEVNNKNTKISNLSSSSHRSN